MAAAAGEVAKDEKPLAAAEKVGSDFISLVVETFGIWTLFALQIIADCTTPRSVVPRKVARKNLLQQLSVQLWTNNARMILQYWTFQGQMIMTIPIPPVRIFPSCSLYNCNSYMYSFKSCLCKKKQIDYKKYHLKSEVCIIARYKQQYKL